MTRDELMQRMIKVEATPRKDRAGPMNVRSRGTNHIEKPDPHPSELFEDFFEYEKEFSDLTPARDTVIADMDNISNHVPDKPEPKQIEKLKEPQPSFIVMEKIPVQEPKSNNIVSKDDSLTVIEVSDELPFEFIQCDFVKDDGHRCKKQAKKGQEYCGIHKKFIAKNEL